MDIERDRNRPLALDPREEGRVRRGRHLCQHTHRCAYPGCLNHCGDFCCETCSPPDALTPKLPAAASDEDPGFRPGSTARTPGEPSVSP
ncbi:hypothetical protein GCM10009560_29730 [Nonomuraea longicatena]|uniref:Uncharacterized protein n=1 Tax=Nonomuraea longicatena TaxID=83682 RepID=A0ABP3ZWQ3_9ACTN